MAKQTFFVSGIDTDIGKTYATAYIAKQLAQAHPTQTVITQKLIQTGNQDFSEDIQTHRQLMGTGLLAQDRSRLTMPAIFSYPASPHLAAEIDQKTIDFAHIQRCTQALQAQFDYLLIEGAGGLMVPLTRELLTIDYVKQQAWPVILVTNGRLGSLNHTLLSLAALKSYGIELYALAYNGHFDVADERIAADTQQFIRDRAEHMFPQTRWLEIPSLA
ncbi:dethiobiotin synthase [Brackiella oedipodis]|uniref:dethiobiotin synthase n=1 Tax=Brackiella oedipodis TaxID=124225 RepID=UPI000491AA2A|nr:dethiobiotin synthase [Brackiella oedipodis]